MFFIISGAHDFFFEIGPLCLLVRAKKLKRFTKQHGGSDIALICVAIDCFLQRAQHRIG